MVIPKHVRDRLRLVGGSRLRMREDGARVVLEPVEDARPPVEVEGVLVVPGGLTGAPPDHRELREERGDRHAGRGR
ncbi:MAG: hypothetical protein A2138_12785 [Deltaproteobacteria bacterium RBG_16_71_12]|nr:MAG: hypothetical protein A2138_12785 [Deltaproteobacteria bacterium RBG_16_71_12]